MDDLVAYISYSSTSNLSMLEARRISQDFLHDIYKGGLEIEEQPIHMNETHFTHDFAGVTITASFTHNLKKTPSNLQCMTINKNKESLLTLNKQKFYRFPPNQTYISQHVKNGVITGSFQRLRNQNSNLFFLTFQTLLLFYELTTIGYTLQYCLKQLNKHVNNTKYIADRRLWTTIQTEIMKTNY